MAVDPATWVEWVRWSARFAAAAFVVAVLVPPLVRGPERLSRWLWLVFLSAQSLHFGLVLRLGVLVHGANMFPGGRSIAESGGWPAVLGIFALFYSLALPVLWRRWRGRAAGPLLRFAATASTLCFGLMLLDTYVPLWHRSGWFVLPVALVAVALVTELLGPKLRRLRCFAP